MAKTLGSFEEAVLTAVVRLRDDAYGPNIFEQLERRLGRSVATGAMYTTLDRLRTDGLLSSDLKPGPTERGGRSRRYYAITAKGVAALNDSRRTSNAIWAGLQYPIKVR